MSEKVLGFNEKDADEIKEKRTRGYNGRIIRYHTYNNILASKLVPVVSLKEHTAIVEEMQSSLEEKAKHIAFLEKKLQEDISLEWLKKEIIGQIKIATEQIERDMKLPTSCNKFIQISRQEGIRDAYEKVISKAKIQAGWKND
jgi:hypothetical protein